MLRARVTEGDDDDSTVKLRPVDLADDEASWRQIDKIRIELDVVGDKQVVSAKLDGERLAARSTKSRPESAGWARILREAGAVHRRLRAGRDLVT